MSCECHVLAYSRHYGVSRGGPTCMHASLQVQCIGSTCYHVTGNEMLLTICTEALVIRTCMSDLH